MKLDLAADCGHTVGIAIGVEDQHRITCSQGAEYMLPLQHKSDSIAMSADIEKVHGVTMQLGLQSRSPHLWSTAVAITVEQLQHTKAQCKTLLGDRV